MLLLTPATAPCPCSRPPTFCSALREQVLAQVEGAAPVSGEDGVYRGMNAYKDYRAGFRREHTIGGRDQGARAAAREVRLLPRLVAVEAYVGHPALSRHVCLPSAAAHC